MGRMKSQAGDGWSLVRPGRRKHDIMRFIGAGKKGNCIKSVQITGSTLEYRVMFGSQHNWSVSTVKINLLFLTRCSLFISRILGIKQVFIGLMTTGGG